MSTKSELLARLAELGPVRVVDQFPLPSDATEVVALSGIGRLDRLVSVCQRLRQDGATLRQGKDAIDDLAASGRSVCPVARTTDFSALARDLAALNVAVHRRHEIADPAAHLAAVRARHGLSQRAFADRLGFDLRTLQNWEQGRNRPDEAVLALVTLFDRDPASVQAAMFDLVAP